MTRPATDEDHAAIERAFALSRIHPAPAGEDLIYRTYPGFDPQSTTMQMGVLLGLCLTPHIPCWTLAVHDPALPFLDGSFIDFVFHRDDIFEGRALHTVKLFKWRFEPEPGWRLIAHDGVGLLRKCEDSLIAMRPLVATIEFGPSWPRLDADESARHVRDLQSCFSNILPAGIPPPPGWNVEDGGNPLSIERWRIRDLPAHAPRESELFPYTLPRKRRTGLGLPSFPRFA